MVQISQDNGILQSNPTAQETQSVAQQLRYPLDAVTQEILREFVQSIAGQLPVGSVYMNVTDSRNPNLILGYGTWTAIEGYVVAGYKAGDPNFGTAGATVGSATHTLTIAEMPAHTHDVDVYVNAGGGSTRIQATSLTTLFGQVTTSSAGVGDAHNNVQPTLVAYVWQRTA